LSAYLNQGVYIRDNNERGSFIPEVVNKYILNYFIQNQILENGVWKRYIKSII
jgi:hypothetical protein